MGIRTANLFYVVGSVVVTLSVELTLFVYL